MATEKRLIEANKLNAVLQNIAEHSMNSGDSMIAANLLYCQEVVDQQPTVDAVEVVHGRWLLDNHACGYYLSGVVCSRCGAGSLSKHNYCPNCGAKMDGERRNK